MFIASFAIVLASVIVSLYAAPLSGNSSTVLERRGAVLSGQFDTESEVRRVLSKILNANRRSDD